MRNHIAAFMLAMFVGVIGLGTFAVAQVSAGSRSITTYLGTWQTVATIHCSNRTGLNGVICPLRLGKQDLAASWMQATSNGVGKFTFTATYMVAEDSPKAKPLCNKNVLSTPYAGSCYITGVGSGIVKAGITGAPDFWVTSETNTYRTISGNVVTKDPMGSSSYPYDTGVPAMAGSFDAARILRMAHVITGTQAPPAGLYIEIQVSHKT